MQISFSEVYQLTKLAVRAKDKRNFVNLSFSVYNTISINSFPSSALL
jgi:hypothetical protein